VKEISPKVLQAGLKHLRQKLVETGVGALVLDAVTLLQPVPMSLGIPAHHGVSEFMEIEDLTVERLSPLIKRVLSDPDYRNRAQYFRSVIAETRGFDVAADVIEEAFLTRAAVARV
jgi:hypothetical protein